MINKCALLPCIVFLFSMCGSQQKMSQKDLLYFDLVVYFDAEAKKLSERNPVIKKEIIRNNKTEIKETKDINWHQELLAFKESDINKPAWKDAFSIDTIHLTHGMQIRYTAMEDRLTVRSIHMVFDSQNKVRKMTIIKQPDKKIFTAKTTLVYVPDSGYSIFSSQKLITFKEDAFTINALFK